MDRPDAFDLPVAVIGAGPVGLAAAAHLLEKGEEPVVFEAGHSVGANVLAWGHVRLFSPWRYAIDAAAGRLLDGTGWSSPEPEAYPTGHELVERYLRPLAETPALRPRVRLNTRVVRVARDGFDKMKTEGRLAAPFLLTLRGPHGREEPFLARAVIDASGTTATPNPLGASGVPAVGEGGLGEHAFYGIPDVLGAHRDDFAAKRVLVVGSGHSAFNALLDLVDLADEVPGTAITWAVRRPGDRLRGLFGGGIDDALPARGELGARVRRLVDDGNLRLVAGFRVARLTDTPEGVLVAGDDEVLGPFDRIVATTGFRPDPSLLAELRLDLDPAVKSPRALAPLIDPNVHSCGSVPPHGEAELRQPEEGAYVVGMKSYGRAPTFLMLTGYEQVRSIACALVGDWEGARDVQLVLPETGVCSSGIVLAERGVACCGAGAGGAAIEAGVESTCCGPASPDESSVGGGSCCGSAVPQLIQLNAATRGGCCN
ncbi:MAG: FAD-dependent oxidoreductase [Chloroflexota bacterium]|nr:FAD-dependent oxidoreductase [Chloroflexota bacterium]